MALIKAVPTPFGPAAAYWNIHSIEHHRRQGSIRLLMAGYIGKVARMEGCSPLATIGIDLGPADWPGHQDGIRYVDLYAVVKELAAIPDHAAAVLADACDD